MSLGASIREVVECERDFAILTTNSPGPVIHRIPLYRLNLYYGFHDVYNATDGRDRLAFFMGDSQSLVMRISPPALLQSFRFLALKDLRRMADVHRIYFWMKTKAQLTEELSNHVCSDGCRSYDVVVFKELTTPRTATIAPGHTTMPAQAPTAQNSLSGPEVVARHSPGPSPSITAQNQFPQADEVMQDTNDTTHLQPLTAEEKFDILSEFEHDMSTDRLTFSVCASCGAKRFPQDLYWSKPNEIDITLLCNPNLPPHLYPREYDLHVYHNAILHHKGLQYLDAFGDIRLCQTSCLPALRKGRMPNVALANDLYTAHSALPDAVRSAFDDATVLDRKLVCRARSNNICCKFVKDDDVNPRHSKDSELTEARRGVRGNVIVVPLDAVRMNSVLPPPISDVKDTMCALFIGRTKPTMEDILASKYSPILARRSRVKTMLEFLLSSNPHYQSDTARITYSDGNLHSIFPGAADEQVPAIVEIGHMEPDDTLDVASAEYAPRANPSEVTSNDQQFLFENVGYTDSTAPPCNFKAMKALALERCKRGKPLLFAGTQSGVVSEFHNPSILTWLFPHLDPWGIIGFAHGTRRVKLTIHDQVTHLLRLHDGRFQNDPEFAFVFYNVLRKMQVSESVRFSVSPKIHRRLATELAAVDADVLLALGKKTANNPMYQPASAEERAVASTIASISMAARHIPGSNGYKVLLRNQIRGLITFRGTPAIFITINPSDVDNPIVRLLIGDDIRLEDVGRGEDMRSWERRLHAARHPAECAIFFDLVIKKFIDLVLRYSPDGKRKGAFGYCDGYYGTVEAQGKGTLHCHMLLWLRGHTSPGKLREDMAASNDYREQVFKWVESVVKCEFPVRSAATAAESMRAQPTRLITSVENGNPNPGVVPAPSTAAHARSDLRSFWDDYDSYLTQLLHQYNWHIHGKTCWKYLRLGEARTDQNCRLRMNGVVREVTTVDDESGALLLRRHHPMVAAYNDIVTFTLKCNSEVKYIGSGKAARDLVFYVTDYITKPTLPLHAGIAALQYAVQKIGSGGPSTADELPPPAATASVVTAVNSVMGRHEISHPQVMSYLIGGGDHYTSHKFTVVNWRMILLHVESEIRRLSQLSHVAGGGTAGAAHEDDGQLSLNVQGDTVTACSQEMDYIYRNTHAEYESLCLYDFFSWTIKSRMPARFRRDGVQVEDVPGSFSDWSHPQRATHHIHHRQDCYVPVLLGPSIPNPERSPDAREKWAKEILILFKPWRSITDLVGHHDTWSSAYDDFQSTISLRHQRIIGNLNAFSESMDARGEAPTHSRVRNNAHVTEQQTEMLEDSDDVGLLNFSAAFETGDAAAEQPPESDVFTCSATPSLQHDLDTILSQHVGIDAVSALDRCHADDSQPPLDTNLDSSRAKELQVEDLPSVVQHQSMMADERKRSNHPTQSPQTADAEPQEQQHHHLRHRIRQHLSRESVTIGTISRTRRGSSLLTAEQEREALSAITKKIVLDMNLESNPEQLRAFTTVADHVLQRDPPQLLMYVAGVGGTGKSHVIKCIIMLFECLGIRDCLTLGAPTGIAAVLIGGHTMNALCQINPNGKSFNVERLTRNWRGIRYLIIDEISMVGAEFLSTFSSRIRAAKSALGEETYTPFGGVNVIFMGDFGQLKPPKQLSLYSHKITKQQSFRTASSIDGIGATNGVVLWRQVTTVVELRKNQRQAADPTFAAFLLRLRLGQCAPPRTPSCPDYWEYLKTRFLARLDQKTLRLFKNAPIIVGSKVVRDALNAKLITYHSRRLSQEVHIYHSTDTSNRAAVPVGLRHKLWGISSSKNNEAYGRLPLFAGMKVMITENIAFGHHIVNGQEGVLDSIYFNVDAMGNRIAYVAYVHVEGCGLHLPGLAQDMVPIYPVPTSIQFGFNIDGTKDVKSFTRKQLPLVPGYAYTDYKSQGRTLSVAIVDIATARGQGVYVMLSRVKELSGLAILRWFPANKVYSRLPEELRDELERLQSLIQ